MSDFSERFGPWAVVTGAAAGVGLAFAEELVSRGVGVVMVDISEAVFEVAEGLDGDTYPLVADVSTGDWLAKLDDVMADKQLGLAVANAGISFVGNFVDMDAATRERILAINCGHTTELAAWAIPKLVERGTGGFVVTSSGSALSGTAGVGLYSATKAFAVNLIEAIGWEIKDSGVVTQAIIAPSMDTPAFRDGGADPERMFAPAVSPRSVVARALDDLPAGGRWLADEGLEFAASLPRADRVDIISTSTTNMYPHIFESASMGE